LSQGIHRPTFDALDDLATIRLAAASDFVGALASPASDFDQTDDDVKHVVR
jgi:hypothetical protein